MIIDLFGFNFVTFCFCFIYLKVTTSSLFFAYMYNQLVTTELKMSIR